MTQEFINKEDLEQIRSANERAGTASLEAERAVALKRVAELERENTVMRIYNKYGLRLGIDQVFLDGRVQRHVEPAPTPIQAEPVKEEVKE